MAAFCARNLCLASVFGVLIPGLAASADLEPTWSAQFAGAGFSYRDFERGPVCLLAHQAPAGSRLYVGGEFTGIGGVAYRSLAAFDGRQWSHVQGLVSSFGDESIAMMTAMPIAGESRVIVAGQFEAPQTFDGLAYIDGQDAIRSLPPGPLSPHAWFGSAFAWNAPSGPELTLGSGLFPQNSDYLYRYTASGYALMSPGVVTIARGYAVFDDGSGPALYIGVQRVGAGPAASVTKWDGTTLTSLPPGPAWVNALCVHDDGDGPALYGGGDGLQRYRAGAWQPVAGAPQFEVRAMASFDDGTGPALYVAGQFDAAGGHPATNIARLRRGVWEPLGGGLSGGAVMDLAVFDEDGPAPAALYAVGTFTHAGGVSSPGIARWGVVVCPSDYDANGVTDSRDFFEFLTAFFAGVADFNHDRDIDSRDFFDFLAAFFAGC